MGGTNTKLTTAVETYFDDLRRIRASGGATSERSSYGPLANLLNSVGATLKPKVFCVGELADQGAGHPDFGLYTAKQVQRGRPREGQAPERGVVEVKSSHEDIEAPAVREQVTRYWGRYRLVLVTNLREFGLVGPDSDGGEAMLESFRLAESDETFARRLEHPRAFARAVGAGLGEYLSRALSHRAALAEPKDLAWLLASYARDGLARVEAAGDAPSLEAVRSALEDALGVRFEGERGARFFRSTLVQTLFYGVFSAWVLWARAGAGSSAASGSPRPAGGVGYDTARFSWRESVWHLRAPVLRALFQQLSDPGRLQPLGLVEVSDWTAAALDRVDREAFFSRFNEGEAVPYFYEPFLEAFDPALRKQLGVWYTPAEVVRYMVARVDRALKDDLDIPDGLAAENVYVLDPCCGTGAYLAEVLRRIAVNLGGRGLGALAGARVRQAATERVFGFEIMPAPFVVAHLQVGLTMQDLDAPLADDGVERAGIYLTNALTGWEPRTTRPLPFPELEEERDRAERVKQETPILVILGNPPYNGFAGMAVDEERELSEAYRTTRGVRRPEGQGLNDLYVRFFRMAERRIAQKTGQGVVCFISNYSWLDGLSFTGMRERYLEAFDAIRIDCLNGDKYKTGKVAPDGTPDPSIFSTEGDPVGIQVGTAIATLVRKADHAPVGKIGFRHLWGQANRLGHARSRRHPRHVAPADRGHRRPLHSRRPQHGVRGLRAHRPLGALRAGRCGHARPGTRRRARTYPGRTGRPRRRKLHPRQDNLRHPPEPTRLVVQRPRRRLALQARRLPGPQEMALLPGARHPRPPAQTGGSPALHRYRPADRDDTDDRFVRSRLSGTSRRYRFFAEAKRGERSLRHPTIRSLAPNARNGHRSTDCQKIRDIPGVGSNSVSGTAIRSSG